jgi:hypothetical protein
MARPRIIKNPEQFDMLAEEYFSECVTRNEPVLLTGLILALGLNSRAALDEYERRPEFFNSVKRAKLQVEMEYERRIGGANPTGAIFALKNFGWRDQQQIAVDHSGSLNLQAQIRSILLEQSP